MKRTLLFVAGFVLVGLLALEAKTEKHPNILLILSDDLNCSLGSYDHPIAKTPNLDKFSKSSVRFDRAYCQYPLCNPSRASFMTGRRPDATQVLGNGAHFREVLPDAVTMSQFFQKQGYFAARVGKIYHYGVPGQIGTDGLDDPPSWNKAINPSGRDRTDEKDVINYSPLLKNIGGSLTWFQAKGTDEEQTDGKVAAETIQLLRENKDKPFFIAAGFYRPHVPCVATKKYFDMYPLDKIKLVKYPPEHLENVPKAALGDRLKHYESLTDEQQRQFLQAYLASVTFVDAQIGKVLKALEDLNLEDETIVLFASDHGWHHGEHGLWQKMSLFEESARVPMMIRVPGAKGNGKASPRLVELIDLYPTAVDAAGFPVPEGLDGKSLKPLLQNPKAEWNRPAFTQVGSSSDRAGRSVRTEEWTYIEWNNGENGAQLYDRKRDIRELNNLAGDPKYAATVAEMKALLPQEKIVGTVDTTKVRRNKDKK